jgi:hypothetical protein
MLLLGEIGIEIVMIAAVIVAVGCLAHLLQLSIREQVYLRRLRGRQSEASGLAGSQQPPRRQPPTAQTVKRDAPFALRQKHV